MISTGITGAANFSNSMNLIIYKLINQEIDMQPTIKTLPEKRFIGKRIRMSLSANKTAELWGSFMPGRREIRHTIGQELYSIEVYGRQFFDRFDPSAEFEKWAAIEVTDFDLIPSGMETLISPGGLYAIFPYKGPASAAPGMYQYIFGTWLPASGYLLDSRPHYAIMGDKYRNGDPASEEELCIPVRYKPDKNEPLR